MEPNYAIRPVGFVRSKIVARADAPLQGTEGAPNAWIELDEALAPCLDGLAVGDEVVLLTWLHQADRSAMKIHPRGDRRAPLTGVFATRSPDRPNPIGLHRVRIVAREGCRLEVAPLEAIDGTPVVDLKTVLSDVADH